MIHQSLLSLSSVETFLSITQLSSVEMTGLEYQGRHTGITVQPGAPGLKFGAESVAAQEGSVYSRRYIYIIYILLTC